MIILSQNRKSYINFDNVKFLELRDTYSVSIIVEYIDGSAETIGTFDGADYGREVFKELMNNYRGSSVVKVPENRVKNNRPVAPGTAKRL